MEQPNRLLFERRSDPRQPRAFAFWIRPVGQHRRVSAWMLDVSAGGAALLTSATHAPPVGTRIELMEMLCADRIVREGAAPLPTYARVIRHDHPEGVTRRIAVQFEADDEARLTDPGATSIVTAQSRAPLTPPPPPPIDLNSQGKPSIATAHHQAF